MSEENKSLDKTSESSVNEPSKESTSKETNEDNTISAEKEVEETVQNNSDEVLEIPDYTTYSKEEMGQEADSLLKESNLSFANKKARALREEVRKLIAEQRTEQLEAFKAEGGIELDFNYAPDAVLGKTMAALNVLKERFAKFRQEQEGQKIENFKKKENILNEIRDLVENGGASQASFEKFKNLQAEWKKTGQVPVEKNQEQWRNYQGLVDIFYNNRSVYFDLLELDRQKNKKAKLALCDKAEELLANENLKQVLSELNQLHEEFKHVGPVPKDDQEPIWTRFKTASDAIYERQKEYRNQLSEQYEKNLVKKLELIQTLKGYSEFSGDRIDDWTAHSKKVLELKEEWKKIGFVSKEKANEINKEFWGYFKAFFNNKKAFFRALDAERDVNYKQKEEFCEKAEELAQSEDLEGAIRAVIKLQQDWKKIGPAPFKKSNQIFERFKKACDTVFNRKRGLEAEAEKEFIVNFENRVQLIDSLKNAVPNEFDVDGFVMKWNEIEKVPSNKISELANLLISAAGDYLKVSDKLSDENKEELDIKLGILAYKDDRNAARKLLKKANDLRRKIADIEKDIATLGTNVEFLASSSSAEKLKEMVEKQIEEKRNEIDALKV